MLSSSSLLSLSSISSSNSSTYGAGEILDAKDLPLAPARCRSSIVSYENDLTLSPPPVPPRRRSEVPSMMKSMTKCHHVVRNSLSLKSARVSLPTQSKLINSKIREEYFVKLCRNHRLLLVLNDYQCQCGCQFSMKEGSVVILYESKDEVTISKKHGLVTVVSDELICSKVPLELLCDVELLRQRVRSRQCDILDEQSFDL